MASDENWRGNRNWKRPSFPPSNAVELTNIIEFPFIQSHRSEGFLRQKYLEEGLSPLEIGDLCFSSKRTILNWFCQFKIPLRPEDVPLRRGLRFGEKRIRGQIIENTAQIKTLHKMRELRAKGYSYPQIVEVMNSLKIKAMNGGKWHLKTVYEVLNVKT